MGHKSKSCSSQREVYLKHFLQRGKLQKPKHSRIWDKKLHSRAQPSPSASGRRAEGKRGRNFQGRVGAGKGGALATRTQEHTKRAGAAESWSYPCIPSCAAQEQDVEELWLRKGSFKKEEESCCFNDCLCFSLPKSILIGNELN